MKTHKHDRRSLCTHALLAAALIALLQERRYADLSVQDILDRANVGRTTFYAHYWDKDDLLASEMDRVIAMLCCHIAPGTEERVLQIPSLALFRHVGESSALMRALTRGPCNDVDMDHRAKSITRAGDASSQPNLVAAH